MTHPGPELADRVGRHEDRLDIAELVARYALAMDDQDLGTLRTLFTPDIQLSTKAGEVKAIGLDDLLDYLGERFETLTSSNHVTHGLVIEFDESGDHGTGVVTTHAEISRGGQGAVAAIRYYDRYVRGDDDRWRFSKRVQHFMYFLAAGDYAALLGDRLPVRSGPTPLPPDWP